MGSPEANRDGLRFSLRTMLIGMAALALMIPLGGYALRNASNWVGSLTFLITTMILAGMACLAFNRQGVSRAYWTGAAIFGIAYYIIGGDPWSQPYNYERFTETIVTAAYNQFYPEGGAAQPPQPEPLPYPIPDSAEELEENGTLATPVQPGPDPPDLRDFVMVAHMFWSLLFAFVGGWVSLAMYWTGRRHLAGS